MSRISRRDFLVGAAAAAGAATFAERLASAAESTPKLTSGTDLVTLGKSKIQTTVLGIGTGTRGGSEQRALGQAEFTKLAKYAFERGIRYFDTADAYMMHLFVGFALKELPREEIFIQTKTGAKHPEVAKADLDRFMRELGLRRGGYIDSVLMHCMTTGDWMPDMRPVLDVLLEAKEKERIRAVGVSCHGFPPLVSSVDYDELDIHLVRINPFQSHMDGTPEDVARQIKEMHQKGRGVIGMKIYGEDGLGSPERRLESLRYVLGLGCVDAFTIGFVNTQQIDETLDLINKAAA